MGNTSLSMGGYAVRRVFIAPERSRGYELLGLIFSHLLAGRILFLFLPHELIVLLFDLATINYFDDAINSMTEIDQN